MIFSNVSTAIMALSFPSRSGRARLFAPSPAKMPRDLSQRKTIEHPIRRHATFARHLDAPMRQIDFAGRMRVRVDAHHAAKIERALMPAPVQIEPPRIGIDLDGDAMSGARGKDFLDIDLVAGTAQ